MKTPFTAAVLIACLPAAASAACYPRDHLTAFLLVEHGLTLNSWGLDDAGNMVELFLGDGGHWAVITTTPAKCSDIAMPHKLRGRLWEPPQQNKAVPPARSLTEGEAL